MRTLGLQDRVPPFDPLTVRIHDFSDQFDDDDSEMFDKQGPGPFQSATLGGTTSASEYINVDDDFGRDESDLL